MRERAELAFVDSDDDATGRVRVKALECYVAAQKAKDPETRDAYLELMRNRRDMADEIEHFEHAWLDREGI